ncbi:MAG: C40 family peptidase [Parachlamydiales bacterium]|nr:C40 family peptidase [Parachlamydiales bacterium]
MKIYTFTYVVNAPTAFMYKSSSFESPVVSQATYSEKIVLLEECGNWLHVKTTYDDYKGWIKKECVMKITGHFFDDNQVIVKTQSLRSKIFSQPSVSETPLLEVPFGSRFNVLFKTPSWLQVELVDGKIGFLQLNDVRIDTHALTATEGVDLAKQFINVPYICGGRSSFGLDSSGFTQIIYREMGIKLPRDSKDQVNSTRLVTVIEEDVQKGDLVFFGVSIFGLYTKILHVGICLSEKEFIHTSSKTESKAVAITSFENFKWYCYDILSIKVFKRPIKWS